MRAAAATAGMLSAAVMLGPGCGPDTGAETADPVRGAAFRALAARHFLRTCPGAQARPQTHYQERRLQELKQLGLRKDGRAIALAENDWAGVSSYADRDGCAEGEAAYMAALSRLSASLDQLAARIADQ